MARIQFKNMLFAGAVVGLFAPVASGIVAPPATAQFSDSYNFLKAVTDRKGEEVEKFLGEPGTVIINTRDSSTGRTALHIVIERRDSTWLGFLLQRGANPNLADKKGTTPLMLATQLGFVEGGYPKANEKARSLADTRAENFSCKSGKTVFFANPGTSIDAVATDGGCED